MGFSFYNNFYDKVRLEDITRTQSPVSLVERELVCRAGDRGFKPPAGPSTFNPLSPNSDQQQFSPNNVYTLLKDKVVRI